MQENKMKHNRKIITGYIIKKKKEKKSLVFKI